MNAMNQRPFDLFRGDVDSNRDELASKISYDRGSGDLTLENGKSRLVLQSNGTIRLEGCRIIQLAEQDLIFEAAIINLN